MHQMRHSGARNTHKNVFRSAPPPPPPCAIAFSRSITLTLLLFFCVLIGSCAALRILHALLPATQSERELIRRQVPPAELVPVDPGQVSRAGHGAGPVGTGAVESAGPTRGQSEQPGRRGAGDNRGRPGVKLPRRREGRRPCHEAHRVRKPHRREPSSCRPSRPGEHRTPPGAKGTPRGVNLTGAGGQGRAGRGHRRRGRRKGGAVSMAPGAAATRCRATEGATPTRHRRPRVSTARASAPSAPAV